LGGGERLKENGLPKEPQSGAILNGNRAGKKNINKTKNFRSLCREISGDTGLRISGGRETERAPEVEKWGQIKREKGWEREQGEPHGTSHKKWNVKSRTECNPGRKKGGSCKPGVAREKCRGNGGWTL